MDKKLSMIDLLFEGQVETKEQYGSIRKSLPAAELLFQLGKQVGLDAKAAALAISKDISVINKDISTISKRIIKNSDAATLKSFGTSLPQDLKLASKELAIKRLYDASQKGNKALTEIQVKSIVEATKSESKILFKDLQISAGKTVSKTKVPPPKTNATKGAQGLLSKTWGWISGNSSAKRAAATLKNSKPLQTFAVRWLGRAGKLWVLTKFLAFAIPLGIAGYIYWRWDTWTGEGNPDDFIDHDFTPEENFLKCIIIPLVDDEGAKIVEEGQGVYLHYTKGSTYDNKGGLIFRIDRSVVTGDGSKKGTWSCNQSGLMEQSNVKGDGNTSTGIGHITIKWGNGNGVVTPVGSVKYVQCTDLPFKYGCINDKIKNIQNCLPAELKPDGYYGPLTSNALWNLYQGNEKSDITKVVYDKVMDACNKKDEKSTEPRPKVEPISKLELKVLAPLKIYDTDTVIAKIDPEKMKSEIQKTIDGRRIDGIIANDLEYSAGRYVLKVDDELTDNQLKTINLYMASKGFKALRKKRETLDGGKYIWKPDSKDAKRIARQEKSIKRKENKIDNIKNKDDE